MRVIKRFIVPQMLLCALLCAPTSLAQQSQDQQHDPQSNNTFSQDVLIIIQREKVRFTSRSAVAEMQLKVFDQTGEMVYDSGVIAEPELDWPLRNANGEAVKSGLYAYTLSIKETGAEKARVRRGHFIVDRAQDRDGADKLWVTSQDSGGVGAELTVARDENATVAGVTTNIERTVGRSGENSKRDAGGREIEAETENRSEASKTAASAAPAGTMGKIAKFTTATEVGDSVITELNGNIGIGTTTPTSSKLTLEGQDALSVRGYEPFITFIDGNHGNARGAIQQVNGGLNLFTDGYLRGADPLGYLRLDTSGNLGIGIATPKAKLEVVSGSGDIFRLTGYQPFITFYDTNHGHARGAIQQVAGGLNLFTDSYLRGANPLGYLRLDNSGNVGIGAADPKAKLVVASGSGDIFHLIGYEPFITFYDSNHAHVRGAIQQVGGGLNLFTDSYLRGANPLGYLRLDNSGNVGVGTATPQAKLDVVGQTRTHSLQITGGADFAENFDVNVAPSSSETLTKVEPGLVVSIDPEHPGKLTLSTQAYDSQVAGIISGAGGVKPGMMMSQTGTLADGQYPVALSGRVYCWADASFGAIKPGDLLTTSATPGHAMKVMDRERAQGAIIGKAMTGLKEGKGLALVLVTLQ